MKAIKRPLVVIAIGMIIGIIYGLYLKISMVLFFILIIIIKSKKYEKINRNKKILITLLISAFLFSIYVNILNYRYERFYKESKETIETEAIIISNKKETDYYNEYTIKANKKKFILYTTNSNLKYGTKIKLKGTFQKPESARNYKGFNYKEYLKTKKIYGSIKSNNIEIISENQINFIAIVSNNVRNKIIETANNILPQKTHSGLLIGILIGEKSNLSEKIVNSFSKSSLSHVLATSGTHISYIILGITYILLKSKTPKKVSYFIIDFILIFFMFIVGFSSSIVRASIMGILLVSSKIVYRKQDTLTAMAISLIITLTYNPFSIKDIGLQLSYLGTLGIILLNKPIKIFFINNIKRIPQKIAEIVSVTISAQILIIPVLILNFNTISFTFLLSNILAIPIVGIIILYGYVNIFIGTFAIKIAKRISIILEILLKFLILISELVSKIPLSKVIIPTPNIMYIILYYLIVFNFRKKKKLKVLIIILILLILINLVYKLFPKQLEIHVIDVGQGDSELIITPKGKVILIDGGEKENILLEYLLDRGIIKIEYILISHFDSDHCYNIIQIIEELKVRNLVISKQVKNTELFDKIISLCNENQVNIMIVEAGCEIEIDKDVKLKILWPTKDVNAIDSLNNNSIVAKLEYNEFSMLFTGDIEEKVEDKLLEIYPKNILKSTILKVAHHGSISSSKEKIIDKIEPKISTIGVGKDNKFKHPNEKIIERLIKNNSQIFRTDLNGEITIKVNKRGRIKINCMNM